MENNSVCILSRPRIQVAQSTYSYTAGFRGMTDIPSVYCFTVFTVSIITVTVVSGDTAWFSVRRLGRGPGYVRDPLKVWIMSLLSVSIT